MNLADIFTKENVPLNVRRLLEDALTNNIIWLPKM